MADIQPNKKVSEEAAAAAVFGTDLFRLVQGAGTEEDPYVSVKATVANLATFLGTGTGGGVPEGADPGSVLYVASDGTMAALPPSTNGDVLTMASGYPEWVTPGVIAPVTAFRWYRVFMLANGGNSYTAIGELELRGSIGGSDLTTPSSPTFALSSFTATPVTNLCNNDLTTPWINNADGLPTWVVVDLVTPQTVVELAMCPQDSGTIPRSPVKFALQGSNNSASDPTFITDWQTVIPVYNYTGWVAGVMSAFH